MNCCGDTQVNVFGGECPDRIGRIEQEAMRLFSIKELERFSNIKAHTIRTWEKRYSVFQPGRTDGNIRSYCLDDIFALLDLSVLTVQGYRISGLVGLTKGEVQERILTVSQEDAKQQYNICRLIKFMFCKSIDEFESVLDECLASWGIDVTIEKIIMPFLERVPILSYKDSSLETHLVVTAIRRKIILGIELTKTVFRGNETAVLFLPRGEHFDLLLLYMNYELKRKGIRVLYLGTNISTENLISICAEKHPKFLLTYVARTNTFPFDEYQMFLKKKLLASKLWVAYAESNFSTKSGYPDICFFDYKTLTQTIQA